MATTYTVDVGLGIPAYRDRNWHLDLIRDLGLLNDQQALRGGAVRPVEIPSASLNVRVASVDFRKSDGTIVGYAGAASQAIPASSTRYLYLTDAGALTLGTGWPATTFHVRLAVVTTDATTITGVTDARVFVVASGKNVNTLYLALAGGTMDDSAGAVALGLGATNGTKIGAVGDKLAFYGFGPIAQQANSVDLVVLLSTLGLRVAGGNPPLNLGTGAVTCGNLSASGTLTLAAQAANIVLAGPTSGGSAAPTFRALVAADLPATGLHFNSQYGDITADADAATITFNAGTSDKHSVTLGGNRTLAVTGDQTGQWLTILLKQDATGSRTVTWWAGILWPGGAAPTLTTTAAKTDAFRILKTGPGAYLGFILGQNL